MKRINLVGQRFGRLLVIDTADSLNGHTRWKCKCDCGNECVVHSTSLKSGNTTSCGCYKTENAKKLYSGVRQNDKRLYAVWNGIKQRCSNKNNCSYHNYGGRGIEMDAEWSANYEAFYNWAIRSGYKKGMEIDRIDNNGNYCEDNCRFVSRDIQANNKRNVKLYTIDGVTKSLAQWCKQYGKDYYHVRQRVVKLGWPILDALIIPKNQKHNRYKSVKGEQNGLSERFTRNV